MTVDIVLTVIFSVEMFIRIIAMGFYDKESTDTYAKFVAQAISGVMAKIRQSCRKNDCSMTAVIVPHAGTSTIRGISWIFS